MSSTIENLDLDNPYYHLRNAEQAELAGELDTAELAYKAAVLAADNLPLAEHRKNFEQELARVYNSSPRYSQDSIDVNELNEAYSRLLSLPIHTRLRLGSLFYVRGKLKESRLMCQEAAEIGFDPLVMETAEVKRLSMEAQKLQGMLSRINDQDEAAQLMSMSHILRARSINKTSKLSQELLAVSGLYVGLNIQEIWEKRRKVNQVKDAHSTTVPVAVGAEPLTCDAGTLLSDMYAVARSFINDLIESGRASPQMFTWTDPTEVDEHWHSSDIYGTATRRLVRVCRCRISDRYWSLSMRTELPAGPIELFLVATNELLNPITAENDAALRARFRFKEVSTNGLAYWTTGGFPMYIDEARGAVRSVLKEIVQKAEEFTTGQPGLSDSVIDFTTGGSMAKKVFELSQQKVSLAEKLVYQHESLQNRIARDIHDAVIADVLAVKRSFTEGGMALSPADIVTSLDGVAVRLRNICQDLSTRDLQDWGLKTVMRDILERVGERCKAHWSLNCMGELPNLPYEVQLHLYRIIQECLNNIEKYAKANRIAINVTEEDSIFSVSVEDDGVGFDPSQRTTRKANEGGMGLNSIRERVALIQCFYPAQVWIQSQVGSGTKTTVQINLARKEKSSHG